MRGGGASAAATKEWFMNIIAIEKNVRTVVPKLKKRRRK